MDDHWVHPDAHEHGVQEVGFKACTLSNSTRDNGTCCGCKLHSPHMAVRTVGSREAYKLDTCGPKTDKARVAMLIPCYIWSRHGHTTGTVDLCSMLQLAGLCMYGKAGCNEAARLHADIAPVLQHNDIPSIERPIDSKR